MGYLLYISMLCVCLIQNIYTKIIKLTVQYWKCHIKVSNVRVIYKIYTFRKAKTDNVLNHRDNCLQVIRST